MAADWVFLPIWHKLVCVLVGYCRRPLYICGQSVNIPEEVIRRLKDEGIPSLGCYKGIHRNGKWQAASAETME
jgi:hypothetical protein